MDLSSASQFYLTLPSNSSMHMFPHNKTSSYVTHLSSPVELDEEYEVALVEMSFPLTFLHFPAKTESITTVRASGRAKVSPLPTRFYASPEDLVYHINTSILKGTPFTMGVDPNGYCTMTRNNTKLDPDPITQILLTPLLMAMLGFDKADILPQSISPFRINIFQGLPQNMFVYCDVVSDSLVGDTKAPLLRVVNSRVSSHPYGATCTVSYERPFYLPVNKLRFQTLEIVIRDRIGQKVSFSHGTLICVLHFRRKHFV